MSVLYWYAWQNVNCTRDDDDDENWLTDKFNCQEEPFQIHISAE